MSLDDWDGIWKRQTPPIGADADLESLLSTFEARTRKRSYNLAIRDYSESSAGLLVILVFGYAWWKMGRSAWPLGISILIVAFVSLRFLVERVRIRRRRIAPNAPMLAKVDNEISDLQRQLEFHQGLFKWYLAPLMVAWAVAIWAMGKRSSAGMLTGILHDPVAGTATVLYLAVIAPFCFWIAYRNISRGICLGLLPRLEELEKLRQSMIGTD